MKDIIKNIFFRKKHMLEAVYAKEEFLEILKRERLRTNRNGIPFSLLIFGKRDGLADTGVFEDLVRVIKPRVRATDDIGWYSDYQIGILLPDTSSEGAKKLAEDIFRKNIDSGNLVYEIQSYPNGKKTNSGSVESSFSVAQKDSTARNVAEKSISLDSCDFEMLFAPPLPLWKRCLDILGAGVGLIISFPIFILIALLIKVVSPGPIFYKQERVGFRKKLFVCLKFRTMKVEADTGYHETYVASLIKDENAPMIKLDDYDPRIIPFGRILRKTCLDELPQLINILWGDMSLVGPRPCTYHEASECQIWHHRRFDTKPGLTGLWQVSGKNNTTFVEMMRLDIGYSVSKSLLKDLWILIKTFPAVCAQVFDHLPKKKESRYEESNKRRRGWLRVLGSKSHSKF